MAVYKARIIGEFDIEAESLEDALEAVKQLNAALAKEMTSLEALGVRSGTWRAVREDMVLRPEGDAPAAEPENEAA